MRTPKAWILHCDGGVDDRAEELHQSRGKFEARVMHGLIGKKFSYMELMDARATRIRALEQALSATQASAAVPGPSGIQGGDGGDDSDNGGPGPAGTQAFQYISSESLIFRPKAAVSGIRLSLCLFLTFLLGLWISFLATARYRGWFPCVSPLFGVCV